MDMYMHMYKDMSRYICMCKYMYNYLYMQM